MPRSPRFFLWLSLASILVILLVVVVGGAVWIRAFLRSDDFLRLVSHKTGNALHAQTTYSPFGWSGSSVFSDRLEGTGIAGSPIKTLRADQIRAQVNWRAIFDGAWRVDDINVGYFEGTFHQPTRDSASTEEVSSLPKPSGLWKYLPQRFELGNLQVAQARLGFLDSKDQTILSVNDTILNLRPDGTGWAIDGQRGTLVVPGFPSLQVGSFRSRLQRESFFLTDASLRLGDTGKISLSGEFAGDAKLEVEWQQVDVAPFLPPQWKEHFSGQLSGTSTISWPASGKEATTATGQFVMKDGMIEDVPMLDQIATFTGAPQFRRMPLQDFSGRYSWSAGQLTLTNLVAESKGLLRLEGGCIIGADGRLQSTLRLGVTPQTLQWLPGSRERVFTVAENGYLWTTVSVTGTLDDPREDLSQRLITAMGTEVIEQGTKAIQNLPAGTQDGAKKVLDMLSPLLR
jgi:hypothetical protein